MNFVILIISFILVGCSTPKIPNDFIVISQNKTTEEIKNLEYKNYKINETKTTYVGNEIVQNSYLKKYIKDVFVPKYQSNINFKNIEKDKLYSSTGYSKENSNINYIFIFSDNGYFRYLKADNSGILKSNDLFDSFGNVVKKDYVNTLDLRFSIIKIRDDLKSINKYLDGSFKYELIYSGKNGNNIKVTYREYSNDMARAAYFQNLTYNLNESNIIRYKNVKIRVLKATNESIKYIVLED